MAPNSEQQCQTCKEAYFEADTPSKYNLDPWDMEDDEDDDWKRLARYIAGIIIFFFVLFKYLI